MKYIYYDFEYHSTAQPKLSVVCCAVFERHCLPDKAEFIEKKMLFWLEGGRDTKAFLEYVEVNKDEIFLSYNVIAEAGAFYSLGLNPTNYNWIDLMTEFKQLKNSNWKREYGKYIDAKSGKPKKSTPPEYERGYVVKKDKEEKKKFGINNQAVNNSLATCLYNILGIEMDVAHKKKMQNRILQGGPFSEQEIKEISEYALEDVNHLSDLFRTMATELCLLSYNSDKVTRRYLKDAALRGEWSARLAVMERIGIPVRMDWLKNLSKNHAQVDNAICKQLSEEVYPFYVWEKTKWVEKGDKFKGFLIANKLLDIWPKTDTGLPSAGKEALEKYEYIPEILEFRRVKDMRRQLSTFKDTSFETVSGFEEEGEDSPNVEGREKIFQRIGSDNRLRSFFNPYGTQTSRNAPPSRNFIYAMSSWLRAFVQPPPGYSITAIDYSSEEFIIAACESGDKNMEKVYDSGDVYLGFAKLVKAVPENADKVSHKKEREMFKSTILGLQFLMGGNSLHLKLMADTKNPNLPREKSDELVDAHKEQFERYWEYTDEVWDEYTSGKTLCTRDSWYLFCDNPNERSVKNFKVQGAGGAILRKAVQLCQDGGLTVFSALHDALYFLHRTEDTTAVVAKAEHYMNLAFFFFYERNIKMEAKTFAHGKYSVEGKGKKHFNSLRQWFMNPEDMAYYEKVLLNEEALKEIKVDKEKAEILL
jgi:DNA polymerase I-like protein with 3'-5' exonuclease and polymerase domains